LRCKVTCGRVEGCYTLPLSLCTLAPERRTPIGFDCTIDIGIGNRTHRVSKDVKRSQSTTVKSASPDMPSLSPPPTARNPAPSQPQLAKPVLTNCSTSSLRSQSKIHESEADARLLNRGVSPAPAFGGKRRVGKVNLGLKAREWAVLSLVCVLGAGVRLWNLGWPNSVV
jgi:hypothetical protein